MTTTVRPTAVAGLFYPEEPDVLRATVDELLAGPDPAPASSPPSAARPKVLIVPHAGYVYSGPIAGTAYRLLARTLAGGPPVTRIVLIGPAHRVYCRGLADAEADAFASPLGAVAVDREALEDLPGRTDGQRAHAPEHCLEVQLPFLRRVVPEARIVPLLVADTSPEIVAEGLSHLWGGPETLILVSSDLSHYLRYEEAQRRDRATADHIVGLGTPTLVGEQACGAGAINGVLALAGERGLRARCLDLRNSGDTAGSRREVVGYGAFAFTEPASAPADATWGTA